MRKMSDAEISKQRHQDMKTVLWIVWSYSVNRRLDMFHHPSTFSYLLNRAYMNENGWYQDDTA